MCYALYTQLNSEYARTAVYYHMANEWLIVLMVSPIGHCSVRVANDKRTSQIIQITGLGTSFFVSIAKLAKKIAKNCVDIFNYPVNFRTMALDYVPD